MTLTVIYYFILFYDNSFMFRSQATQPVVTDAAISDISLSVVKKEREDSFTLQNEKKVIRNCVIALFL